MFKVLGIVPAQSKQSLKFTYHFHYYYYYCDLPQAHMLLGAVGECMNEWHVL